MPKLKKPPQAAYYFFMKERREQLEAQGSRFPQGMRDVNFLVCGEWKVRSVCCREFLKYPRKALSEAEKQRYKELAKEAKEMEKTNFENKFTTSGESYASLNRRIEATNAEKAELKALFLRIVRSEIPTERIYVLVQAIPSCEVGLDNLDEKKEYYPLEISLAAFSLKDGFICQYWSLINTKRVPCGYASSAKDTSVETGLPQPGSSVFQKEAPEAVNYNKIMINIRRFVETWCSGYPDNKCMVFVTESNINSVRGCIEWLVKNADENAEINQRFLSILKFYSLASLVIELAVLGHEIDPDYKSELHQFKLHDSAESLLSSGYYDHKEQITCSYHNNLEDLKMPFCCKNYVLRRIFIILEEFCKVYSCHMTDRHKINSYFKNSEMPDHLFERIRQQTRQVCTNSSSKHDDKSKPYWRQDNLSHASSELCNADLRNSDLKFQQTVDDKRETVNEGSVSTGSDRPTDFNSCYERRKRKRSSSPVSPSGHFSLDPAKSNRREDSTRSSSEFRTPEPEEGRNREIKSEPPINRKNEFESFENISQLPSRGRGRGLRRYETESNLKKEESPGLPGRGICASSASHSDQ